MFYRIVFSADCSKNGGLTATTGNNKLSTNVHLCMRHVDVYLLIIIFYLAHGIHIFLSKNKEIYSVVYEICIPFVFGNFPTFAYLCWHTLLF